MFRLRRRIRLRLGCLLGCLFGRFFRYLPGNLSWFLPPRFLRLRLRLRLRLGLGLSLRLRWWSLLRLRLRLWWWLWPGLGLWLWLRPRLSLGLWLRLSLWLWLWLGLSMWLLPRLLLPRLVLPAAVSRSLLLRWWWRRRGRSLIRWSAILRRRGVPRRPGPAAPSSSWPLVASRLVVTLSILLVRRTVLLAAQKESRCANTCHQCDPEERPHLVGAVEHGCHHGAGHIRHDDDCQRADDAGNKAVPLWLEGRQVEEARAGRVFGDDEDVVFAGRETGATGRCPGVLPMRGRRRRRRWLAHGSRRASWPETRCIGLKGGFSMVNRMSADRTSVVYQSSHKDCKVMTTARRQDGLVGERREWSTERQKRVTVELTLDMKNRAHREAR